MHAPRSKLTYLPLEAAQRPCDGTTNPHDVVCFFVGSTLGKAVAPTIPFLPENKKVALSDNNATKKKRLKENFKKSEESKETDLSQSKAHIQAYRAIFKLMYKYHKKNKDFVIQMLTDSGFSPLQRERCYNKIGTYSALRKRAQDDKLCGEIMRKILKTRKTYTHVLMWTLEDASKQPCKKLKIRNLDFYQKLCTELLEKSANLCKNSDEAHKPQSK